MFYDNLKQSASLKNTNNSLLKFQIKRLTVDRVANLSRSIIMDLNSPLLFCKLGYLILFLYGMSNVHKICWF